MNKLGDYLTIKHGWSFKGEFFSETGTQSILTPGNFYEKGGFKYNDDKERFYTGDYPPEYLCKKGDLIIAMTEQAAGLLGSTAIVPENDRYLHNQRVGLILCDEEKLFSLYAYYLFMTHSVREQIAKSASGTKVKHTAPERIYDVKVQIPDISTQIKVADFLWAIDSKIQVNIRIASELESMAKTIYDYWFTQFDFPDTDGKPYRSSGGMMEWNAQLKKEIPQGWLATTMSALTTVVTGKEDANFSVQNGKYKFFTCAQETILCDTPAFSGHAVLIAGNGDFNVKHYTGHFNAYQRTYVLIPNDNKYYAIMYIAAQQRIQAFKQGSNGSIVKFITKGDVENIPILIPADKSLLTPLNQILEKIEHCERENDELTKLRDWLLPMLMNGQATVE